MSKIINAVLSKFSAKYKSIDELSKLYLAQLQTKDYAAAGASRREQAGWRYIVRQPAAGGERLKFQRLLFVRLQLNKNDRDDE